MSKGKRRREAREKRIAILECIAEDHAEALTLDKRETAQRARRRRVKAGGPEWPRRRPL